MNDLNTAPVEPQSTDVPATDTTDLANPENLQPGPEPKPEPQAEPQPKDEGKAAKEAMQRRINRLTAEKYQERAQKDQLAKELEQFRLEKPAQDEPQRQPQQPYPQEAIQREAERIAVQQTFVKTCNDIVVKGKAEFTDFDAKLTELVLITGPFLDDKGQPEPFLQAVLTTDAPHKVLQHLASHPDIAAGLVDLTPLQQSRKLGLIEQSMNAKPIRQPSSAAKPLEPVSAAAAQGEPDPADAERWIAWRNKTAKR